MHRRKKNNHLPHDTICLSLIFDSVYPAKQKLKQLQTMNEEVTKKSLKNNKAEMENN